MNTQAIRHIIADARARDTGQFEAFLRRRMKPGGESDLRGVIEFTIGYIESVPALMERVEEAARARGLDEVVRPLLARAEEYFIEPADVLPVTVLGLVGLLDDAYLALSLLEVLLDTPDPLVTVDLKQPNALVRALLGDGVGTRLDAEVRKARHRLLLNVVRALEEADGQPQAC
jgi:uncharacterized membrane protein YkvA (DUF1232 family)